MLPPGVCPDIILCERSQPNHEKNDFNNIVVKVLHCVHVEEKDVIVINFTVYGVSVDYQFLRGDMCNFISGKGKFIDVTYPNHNTKSEIRQIIGSSCILVIRKHIVDYGMLIFSRVLKEIRRAKYFASGLLLLLLLFKNNISVPTLID